MSKHSRPNSKRTEGELTLSGVLTAHKLPKTDVVKITAHDEIAIAIREGLTAHGRGDHSEALRVCDDFGLSTTADILDGGQTVYEMKGPSPQGESGCGVVAKILAEAISKREGTKWTADEENPQGPECGVDWWISTPGKRWPVQVTRTAGHNIWRALGKQGVAREALSDEGKAVTELQAAVERKMASGDPKTILALDARFPGVHAFRRVTEQFERLYGRELKARIKFAQVWVVGATAEMTTRVDQ